MKKLILFLFVIASISNSGCYRFNPGPPGTINQQRNRAAIHDPFPETEVGPEVVGGRPRGFDRPLPEAERNPLYRDTFGGQ